ncbi:hypothetical protein [Actinocorallia sp. A-T 12471]|uniref:hypothetical protein n=1 Tax=Actinocorallia sp. A-T 12471 TaxID=3089813 RepID=UPI0029CECBD3|nr:hypothetical protein [Actinocorallia sp. A-T 12471]MDX6743738.1 hypothetical protein [Actinocorallia sp. A-T 12471]
MPRVTTVLFACGALSLGAAVFGVPGSAGPPAPQTVVAEGRFKTADGKGAAFRHVRASGRYEVTEDTVTVRFTITDRKRDGWTAGVQFATGEAWDEHHSPVYFPSGTAADPQPGVLRGPKVAEARPRERPRCPRCKVVEPRKRKGGGRLADGRLAYRYPRAFTSSFTEHLWVREVLIKKDGRRTIVRPGRAVAVYRAPDGIVYPGAQRSAPLPPGSRFAPALPAALPPAQPATAPGDQPADAPTALPAAPHPAQPADAPTGLPADPFADAPTGLPADPSADLSVDPGGAQGPAGRRPPVGTLLFSTKQFRELEVAAEPWGGAGHARRRQDGDGEARMLLRIRDLAVDRRLPGVIVTFTDEDGTRIDTWTFWNARDSSGRWTSRLAVNKLSGHLFYRPCVGTQSRNDGVWAYEPVACGDTRQVY